MRKILVLARTAAFIGIIESIAALVLCLYRAYRGDIIGHMLCVSLIALPLLVSSIAIGYLFSAIRRTISSSLGWTPYMLGVSGLYCAEALSPPLLVTSLSGMEWITLLLALCYATLSQAFIVYFYAPNLGASIRLSIGGLGLAFLLFAVINVLCVEGVVEANAFTIFLSLVYALPVTSIYAVSVHSLPLTYNDKPRFALAYIVFVLHAVGVISYFIRERVGSILIVAAMLIYLLAARFDKLRNYMEKVKGFRSSPARSTHLYFLLGHVFVALYVIAYALISTVFIALQPAVNLSLLVARIHVLTVGFVLANIYVHAPLMLPVLLGVPTAKRYTALNYILQVLAVTLLPVEGDLALLLLVLSLLTTVLIVIPRGWPCKLPLQV